MFKFIYLLSLFILLTSVETFYSVQTDNIIPCQVDTTEVHFKDFDFQKFVGLWHTTWKSRSLVKEEHPRMETRNFYIKEDGTMSIVHTKKTKNGGCSMYETMLSAFGNATYIENSEEKIVMTVIETDYHSASLLMCCPWKNFQDGLCDDSYKYFEVISRDIQIVPEIEFILLSKVDELCSSTEDMVYLAAECQDGSIVVDTIPVLPRFDLNTKTGLSFALSQTNFTKPNSLTGYNIYISHISRMIGWFSVETSDGGCSQVMSTMIKQHGKSGADVYNRLGGLASPFPWYHWQVLYSDANYSLAYFCYAEYNGTCPRQAEEIRLDGRLNTIDPAFRKKLYMLLQKVCISPQFMTDLVYTVDCASVLLDSISSITEEFEKLKENKCTFENLVTSHYNQEIHQMEGIWYNVAAINADPGEMLYIIPNQNRLEIFTCEPINDTCQWSPHMRWVQLCDGIAEFIKHVISANTTATATHLIRMAYIDEMSFLLYECHSESEGMCEDGHLVFRIYSRVQNMSSKISEELEDFLPFFCLNISRLQTETNFPIADNSTIMETDFPQLSECAVENITHADNFNQTKILGYWHEIARSGLEKNTFQNVSSIPDSAVVYFAENEQGHLTFNYFAALGDKCVSNIFDGKTRPRCEQHFDGNYISRFRGKSWAFFKIIYMDDDSKIMMYACTYLYPDGQCAFPLLHVLGKEPKYPEQELKILIDKGLKKSCIQAVEWTMPEYKKNCTDFFISEQNELVQQQWETSDDHPTSNESHNFTILQQPNENGTKINLPSDAVEVPNK